MSYRYFIVGVIFFILFSTHLAAQSVGVGTNEPSENAALHIVSPNNNQGILIPSLTTEQRLSEDFVNSLSAEDNGLLVFDLTQKHFYFWSDNGWMSLVSGSITQILNAGEGIAINDQSQIVNIGDTDSTDDVTIQTEAEGDLTGVFPAPEIAEGVVDTENLADSAVVGDKISDNTIPVTKLTGLSDPISGRNSFLITSNNNTPQWFRSSPNQLIGTDNFGQITTRDITSFRYANLETGHIFVGENLNAVPLDASREGYILVGNRGTLESLPVTGDISIVDDAEMQLNAGVVTSAEIADAAIVAVDIADEAITGDQIMDGSVTSIELAADAVGSGTIANETILNEDISLTAGIEVAKLEAMSTGTIIYGDNGVPTIGTVSGDISIDEDGEITLNPLDEITVTTGNFTTLIASDGSNIESLNADNLTNGTVPDNVLLDVGTAGTYGGDPDYIESITVDDKGRVTAISTGVPASDIRLKENLRQLTYSPQNLDKLQAYHYTWKENRFGDQPQIGLIAQEVEQVYPELVRVRSDGFKGVYYQGLIPVLVEATKSQQDSITIMQEQNQELQNRVDELEGQIEAQSQELQNLRRLVEDLIQHTAGSPSVTQSEAEHVGSTNR